jgi:hypothetical protein
VNGRGVDHSDAGATTYTGRLAGRGGAWVGWLEELDIRARGSSPASVVAAIEEVLRHYPGRDERWCIAWEVEGGGGWGLYNGA